MDRFQQVLDWWKRHNGLMVDIGDLVPELVLHEAPGAEAIAPRPMLIGARSLQRTLLGSHDAIAFQRALSQDWPGYSARVVETHRRVITNWAPDHAVGRIAPDMLGGRPITFERLLLPLRTDGGQHLLATLSREISVH